MRLTALLIPALLIAAAPAGAQIVGQRDYSDSDYPAGFVNDSSMPRIGTSREVRGIRRDVERARDAGLISRADARRIRREANVIARMERTYGSDGLTPSEARELDTRAELLRAQLGQARTRPPGTGNGAGTRR